MRNVYELLGDDAENVRLVAISVDPSRDSVEKAYEYSERWQMIDRWTFLVGEEATLRPVWASYYIDPAGVVPYDTRNPSGLSEPPRGAVTTLTDSIANAQTVIHSAPIYLIDREGLLRGLHTLPLDPKDLVKNIRSLLR